MSSLKKNLDLIQKKAQERTVKTQTIEYDLETLVKKIEKNVIKLNPEYQRHHRWADDTSSKLMESLILNIPIPFIYISQDVDVDAEVEDDVARYSVIDGQQRLTAIFKYFRNKYPLTGLEVLVELNGSYYKDLPPFLIRRLEERTISCLRIDSTVDAQVKYDIFERLNSGAVKLESQELRNATCRGPFNELIKELATNKDFVTVAHLDSAKSRVSTMEDQELVLRFFALAYDNGHSEYKGGFKTFLTEKMKSFNQFDSKRLTSMRDMFLSTIKIIRETFGDEPFAKYKFEDGNYRRMSKFNAAVFDSVIVPFSKLIYAKELNHISYEKFKELFKDPVFFSSVEGSVNDVAKLSTRLIRSSVVIK